MVADCLDGDHEFGIVCHDGAGPDADIVQGKTGTIAHIDRVSGLPDGRSHVVVHGVSRFEVMEVRQTPAPYLMADVQLLEDRAEPPDALSAAADDVRALVRRAASAVRAISDDASPVPDLPFDAALLSFAIAQSIDLDLSVRQSLLESRSPLERLRQLKHLLTAVIAAIEARASTRERAHSNGHGPMAHG